MCMHFFYWTVACESLHLINPRLSLTFRLIDFSFFYKLIDEVSYVLSTINFVYIFYFVVLPFRNIWGVEFKFDIV